MFKKSQLALFVGATLASSMVYVNAAEKELNPEDVMVITAERANYKADNNTGKLQI